MAKTVHVIGGGIIGLSSAWYLRKEGFEVTVVDRTDLTDGASHGNAGMVVPSHFVPLASPGVVSKGLKWMFNSKSPFFIKPRLDNDLVQWLWKFYNSCTPENVSNSVSILKDFNELSKGLYKNFSENEGFEFSFEENGLLMLFKDSHAGEEEIKIAEKGRELGLEVEILNQDEVQQKEKNLKVSVAGGVYYPGDTHLYPNLFIQQMVSHLKKKGVEFLTDHEVVGISASNGKVDTLKFSNDSTEDIEELVVAAGSWSAKLLKQIGVKIHLQDGKGYSFTQKSPDLKPTYPTILSEGKVAMTPMGNDLRIGGTLEISNFNSTVNRNRLAGILESVPTYFPELNNITPEMETVWHGFRPCTPDGLPYIGRSSQIDNLTVATGHAMMGMSLGPQTGKLVSQIITDQKTDLDLSLMGIDRL
ncbi:MAG: FAD-dependent oxidoreductase [Balneola sp.]